MKKYLQIIIMFGILLILVWIRNIKFIDEESSSIKPNLTKPTNNPTETLTISPTSIPQKSVEPTKIQSSPTPTPIPKGKYRDGSYTGSVEDAFYGNIQVQAVILGGKISDITFLQYPNDNHTSIRINSEAMPILISEAIQIQSENVSGVSGASSTYPAFKASLANALNQAKN